MQINSKTHLKLNKTNILKQKTHIKFLMMRITSYYLEQNNFLNLKTKIVILHLSRKKYLLQLE